MKRRPPDDGPTRLDAHRRVLRAVPAPSSPPPPADYATPDDAAPRRELPIPTVAVLRARPDADLEGLVGALLDAVRVRGGRAALLWSERTDALDAGVVTVAESAALFPERLQEPAARAHRRRIAHLGRGAEAQAVSQLSDALDDCTHAVLDGRLLAGVRPALTVLVSGDGIGEDAPFVRAVRPRCDTEVYSPSDAIAAALVRALERRA